MKTVEELLEALLPIANRYGGDTPVRIEVDEEVVRELSVTVDNYPTRMGHKPVIIISK